MTNWRNKKRIVEGKIIYVVVIVFHMKIVLCINILIYKKKMFKQISMKN
jgi:hypothetical protein